MQQNKNDFDFTKNDKFYTLTIPKYLLEDNMVFYEFHLLDLVTSKEFIYLFRFKELKQIHEIIASLKLELPDFPKTHFWRKTNKNQHMIEERRMRLESFFHIIINDPLTRGHAQIKKLINKMKYSSVKSQSFHSPHSQAGRASSTRSHSLSKTNKNNYAVIDIEELKQMFDSKQTNKKSMNS